MNQLAPISISTYSRLEHLTRTIDALKINDLAKNSILYIFSDAPKEGDEIIVKKVRDYLKTINGFKEVRIIEQETNNYEKNIKDAYSIPLNKFGKMIRMEDDILTSPYFLKYMNESLNFYQNERSIFAISAYTPSTDLEKCLEEDVFLSKDFSAWGYATWADRDFFYARERMNYYDNIILEKDLVKKINKLHPKMIDTLHLISQKKANPGDYKLSANLHLNGLFTIKPKLSLVKNIGFDGSGAGKRTTNRFQTSINETFFPKLTHNLKYNEKCDFIIFDSYFNDFTVKLLLGKFHLKIKIYLSKPQYNRIKKCVKKFI